MSSDSQKTPSTEGKESKDTSSDNSLVPPREKESTRFPSSLEHLKSQSDTSLSSGAYLSGKMISGPGAAPQHGRQSNVRSSKTGTATTGSSSDSSTLAFGEEQFGRYPIAFTLALGVFLAMFSAGLFSNWRKNSAHRQVKQAVKNFHEASTNYQLMQSINSARRLGRFNLLAICTVMATCLLIGFAIVYHRYRRIALARRKSFAYWMFTALAIIGGIALVLFNAGNDQEPHPLDKWLQSGRDIVIVCAIFGIMGLAIHAKQTSLPYESKLDVASTMAGMLSKGKSDKSKDNSQPRGTVQTAKLQVIRDKGN